MKNKFDLVIIGAGSGGLYVASGAAALGARVVLIESEKMGGDCLNSGCIPSKSFLKGAHLAKDIRNSQEFGIHTTIDAVKIDELMSRVQKVIAAIEPHDSVERFEGLGVKVILGKAQLLDAHTVLVNGKPIISKAIVISTGSQASVPPIKGLASVSYLTNKNIFNLKTLPRHLIVLGGGPIGLELGQGFSHLGSEVTIIDFSPSLFGKDDQEVGPLMEKIFRAENIHLKLSTKIIAVSKKGDEIVVLVEKDGVTEEIVGDELLVSLGRAPVTEGLGLDKLGIRVDKRGYIVTNKKLQTNIKNIYACGDVTGPYQFTHMASYQAGIVLKNSLFHLCTKADYTAVPWTTYTKPEVAHVGYTEAMARESKVFKSTIIVPLNDNDRAKAENDTQGFLKLIIGNRNKLIGATLVGEKAGEIMPVATLAIHQKLSPGAFLKFIFAYPTEAEIFQAAATQALRRSFKPWQTKLIKALFFRYS
ncbi:MAG: dihydrolipoyl dehydrogenase family protein [Acetobacterium sp.]